MHSGNVEFVRDKIIHKYHFPLQPFCLNLPEDEKVLFTENADRANPKAKIVYLINNVDDLIDIGQNEQSLLTFFNKSVILSFLVNNITLFRDISFICALIINFGMLIGYKVPEGEPDGPP